MPEQKPNYYLKDLDVEFISLVDRGANKKQLVYKSASADHSRTEGPQPEGSSDSFEKQVQIKKTDDDKRLVYCIVYSPGEVDTQDHAMKAEEIEKAAHNFLFEGRVDKVDKQHDEDPDEGRVVESYIIGKSDDNFPDDPEGSWAVVIKVLNDDTWEEVKDGDITGVSLQGKAQFEEVDKADDRRETGDEESAKSIVQKFMGLFKKALGEDEQEVEKDFTGRLMQRKLNQATWALQDAINEVLNDDDMDTFAAQKTAIMDVIEEFGDYVSDLKEDTSKQFNPDMSEKNKESEETKKKETTDGNEPSELEQSISKAVGDVLDEKLGPIEKQLNDFEERLEEVEKAAPGSQQEKGQDEKEETKKSGKKGYKGINFLGGSPKE